MTKTVRAHLSGRYRVIENEALRRVIIREQRRSRMRQFYRRAEFAFIVLAFAYFAAHLLRALLKAKGVI